MNIKNNFALFTYLEFNGISALKNRKIDCTLRYCCEAPENKRD